MAQLAELGTRICILGPSNSGKSTLAAAIGQARGLEVVHLDRLYHDPGSDWVPRGREAFVALHDEAISHDGWVMDGNYSRCMPQRFARATGVIVLEVPTSASLLRYFRRTLFERRGRVGGLDGDKDSLKWSMIRYIAVTGRQKRERYDEMLRDFDLPKTELRSIQAVRHFYQQEALPSVRAVRAVS